MIRMAEYLGFSGVVHNHGLFQLWSASQPDLQKGFRIPSTFYYSTHQCSLIPLGRLGHLEPLKKTQKCT